jgi:hypothetical protein
MARHVLQQGGNIMLALFFVMVFAVAGCGDGSLVNSEVNPELTDSVNPEVNPTVDLDAPVSVLGLN